MTEEKRRTLTPLEQKIVRLLVSPRDSRNKEIAAVLGLAENTVKNAMTTIFGKLGVQTRTEAILVLVARERSGELLAGVPLDISAEPLPSNLTKRQREVLGHLATPGSAEQISARLGISPYTLKNYLQAIYDKLGVTKRSEAVVRFLQSGELDHTAKK